MTAAAKIANELALLVGSAVLAGASAFALNAKSLLLGAVMVAWAVFGFGTYVMVLLRHRVVVDITFSSMDEATVTRLDAKPRVERSVH